MANARVLALNVPVVATHGSQELATPAAACTARRRRIPTKARLQDVSWCGSRLRAIRVVVLPPPTIVTLATLISQLGIAASADALRIAGLLDNGTLTLAPENVAVTGCS